VEERDAMQIGEYEILPVIDGTMRSRPTITFPNTTDDDWQPHRDLLDEFGLLNFAFGGFLVRGGPGGRVVLVDAGLGHHEMFGKQRGGQLLESLAVYGLRPEDVTDVVFTHLHLDHVGWASDAGAVVFSNAAYRCDVRDWEYYYTNPAAADPSSARVSPLKEALTPAADRVTTWKDDAAILPGINVMHAPGHTPGSAIIVVSSGEARALLLGDVVHCPIELLDDEWAGMMDVDPALAKRTRVALAREIEGQDVPIAAAHFPDLKFGRLLLGEGQRRWVV
jgi:glyoxylase-like metal-dependent hydrolase (beta-lactamase superfamily II)